jgi:hypothetical protein
MTATIKTTVIKEATSSTDNITLDSSGNVTSGADAVITGKIGAGGTNYGTSGQVLTSGGSGSAPSWSDPAAGGVTEVKELVFESSGTYTPNTNANFYEVVCIGGGQAGYRASSSGGNLAKGNPGAGAGGAIVGFTPAQMGASSITVTIGAGGTFNGSAGGASSFGSYITTNGGSGGSGGTYTVNTGTANVAQNGNAANTNNSVKRSGYSIRPYSGPTGQAVGTIAPTSSIGGIHASLPGSGGGGGTADTNANTNTTGEGGYGGDGIVIVREYL